MGNIWIPAAFLSILFFLFASVAASRVLPDDEKVSPSPLPDSVSLPKTNSSQLTREPTSNPNNTDGSIYPPPPPGKQEVKPSLTRGEHGPKTNPENSTSLSGANKDDSAKHESTASESKDEGKESRKGGDKPADNTMEKKVMDTCDSSSTTCNRENLVACLRNSWTDKKKLSIVIQNIGKDDFTVKIRGSPALHIDRDSIRVLKDSSTKINLQENQNVTEIILDAGTGECILHIATPAPYSNLFPQFSSYDIHLTPIYGVYVLVGTIVVVGATWVCCKLRKKEKRENSGGSYQQLEMSAQPQHESSADSHAQDGWDDDWDDDWNDEDSTRPSEKYSRGSVSSNGLTSRAPKKDGWEDAWED